MNASQLLSTATPQEIQLELIRRRRFNQFDGQVVVESLRRHRTLWASAFMSMSPRGGDGPLPYFFLIPLRELPSKRWQVDTLFVLCECRFHAEQLRDVAREENWQFDEDEIYTGDVVEDALGEPASEQAILELWWD